MSQKIWAVRANEFAYNDEYFFINEYDGRVNAVYSDPEQAAAACRVLEVAAFRRQDIEMDSLEPFVEGKADVLATLDALLQQRLGKPLLDERGYLLDEARVHELQDDDLYEFIERAGIRRYSVVEFFANARYSVLWLPATQAYVLTSDDQGNERLYYDHDVDNLLADLENHYDLSSSHERSGIVLTGTPETLSDTPALLESALASFSFGVTRNMAEQQIVFRTGEALLAINALLKQPLFEVRELTMAELLDIEVGLSS